MIKFTLFIIFLCIIASLCSCTKQEIGERHYTFDKYQLYIDHYSKDTTRIGVRTLWGQWYLPKDKNGGMDTIKMQVFLNCITDSIERWYYKINDIGFQTKLLPSRIDTNWFNYTIK